MYKNNKDIRNAIRDWVGHFEWVKPFAVTLTLRQGMLSETGQLNMLTSERASQNMRHFQNLLNRRIFGKAFDRFDRRLNIFVATEGGVHKRLHHHLIIDCPQKELEERFPSIVREMWLRTDWGYDEIDIKPAEPGWLNYITKFRDKTDYDLAFDWQQCHLIGGAHCSDRRV